MKMIGGGAQEAETLFGYFQIAGTVIGRLFAVIVRTAHNLHVNEGQNFVPKNQS
jgi:hypothetical protein